MGIICEHEFEQEDPKNKGYSMTEYDLYAKLNLTIRKNLAAKEYEIVNISTKEVKFSSSSIHDAAREANRLEGAENTKVECGSLCPEYRKRLRKL